MPGGVADVLPLSPLQEGLYFHAVHGGDDVYVVQQILELEGALDPDALREAAARLAARHDALRATFRELPGGRLVQVIAAEMVPDFTVADGTCRGDWPPPSASAASRWTGARCSATCWWGTG